MFHYCGGERVCVNVDLYPFRHIKCSLSTALVVGKRNVNNILNTLIRIRKIIIHTMMITVGRGFIDMALLTIEFGARNIELMDLAIFDIFIRLKVL